MFEKEFFDYDNMKIIYFDNKNIACLSYKDTIFAIKNSKENELIINKSLYQNYDFNIYKNKTLFNKVKKFLVYYFSIHINNIKDFENFVFYCYQYNEYKVKSYNHYIYNGYNLF